jgi:hypothetical protein
MFKIFIIPFFTTILSPLVFAKNSPVIRSEIKEENGRKVEYMYIDGIKVHETDPGKVTFPHVVEPKPYDALVAKPPKEAIVLFDGTQKTLKNWTSRNGGSTKWKLINGALESFRGAGPLQSKQGFGSCKLHVEFATPHKAKGEGQGRGNSGVFLMGRYEVQILDSYNNITYPDGQCGALYGRAKPLVNACRPPGEWQSYDITFYRPEFDKQGKITQKAKFHVIHNGHVIHDHLELSGGTGWRGPHAVSDYVTHGDKGPLKFQDHGNPVRFRNVWIVPIKD